MLLRRRKAPDCLIGFLASSLACPPARLQPPSAQLREKTAQRVPYDPNDFTSDELDPAFEWPREPPLPWKCDLEVILLQSILSHFPLGLRLEKLVTMMWKEHKVHLWKMSMERGYRNILQFLEEVPGIRLTVTKGGSRYLVHMF
uniref:Uncharacterized protein n=1 Tax=Sphaerodactylus townsendi TaxID=933632 RepID=A0ACB8EVM9_9SAUR